MNCYNSDNHLSKFKFYFNFLKRGLRKGNRAGGNRVEFKKKFINSKILVFVEKTKFRLSVLY